MLYDVLDKIVPYLPGGSKACFGNVFVGTVSGVPWNGNEYREGVQDPQFRQMHLDLSKLAVQNFMKKYPTIQPFHWYISFESNLNYLADVQVMEGYKAFLTGMVKMMQSENRGSVMWSPVFWDTWASVPDSQKATLRSNLNNLFSSVATNAPPGINWMNLQDMVGRYNEKCGWRSTPEDAVQWYRFLQGTYSFRSLQVNEEMFQFTEGCAGLVGTNASVQIQREKYYTERGVRMGAAFELRYWREK